MLYAVKDHCYRPTNRQIDNFAVAVNHAWRDVPPDPELERAARQYAAVLGTKSKKRGEA